jgi:hypothetical protein
MLRSVPAIVTELYHENLVNGISLTVFVSPSPHPLVLFFPPPFSDSNTNGTRFPSPEAARELTKRRSLQTTQTARTNQAERRLVVRSQPFGGPESCASSGAHPCQLGNYLLLTNVTSLLLQPSTSISPTSTSSRATPPFPSTFPLPPTSFPSNFT